MKNITIIFVFLIVYIYSPRIIHSQSLSESRKIEVHLTGGISFPSQPKVFTDYWSFGYNVGGGFGYKFSTIFSSSIIVNFNSFPFNDGKFLRDLGIEGTGIEIDGGSVRILTVSVSVKARLTENYNSIIPYLIGGLGYFTISTGDIKLSYGYQTETTKGESESAFSFLFGGGVEIAVGANKYFFIELNYGQGFTKEDHTGYIPLKIGFIILIN
jgi:hypothetical protein